MSTLIQFFNKTSNKTRGVGIFLVLLIMTIMSCPNADSGSSSGGGSDDSGPLVVTKVELIAGGGTAGTDEGKGENAKFNKPRGMAVDTDGTIYVADVSNHSIRKITPGGVVSTYAGLSGAGGNGGNPEGIGGAARFNFPANVFIKDGNTFYVIDDNGIRKIVKDTATVSTFATRAEAKFGTNSGGHLKSIIRKPNTDTLYILDSVDNTTNLNSRVIEHTGPTTFNAILDTSPITNVTTSHQFSDAVFDSAGNMYVSTNFGIITFNPTTAARHPTGHTYANHIKEVTVLVGASTDTAGYVDGVGTEARFYGAQGIIIKGDYIYVADALNDVIRMVQISTKTVSTLVGIAGTAGQVNGGKDVATFNKPRDLEFAPNGDIILSEDHAIRRIVVQK